MKTTLLIDGDEFLFKATSVCEREVRWDEFNHVLYCNRNEAWENFQRLIRQLTDRFDTKDAVLCFGSGAPEAPGRPGGYFRHALFPNYKGGRPGRKPLCYADLREMCGDHYCVRSMPGIEADDVMGILATKPSGIDHGFEPGPQRIIVSQDKDMLTVPGLLLREQGGEVLTVSAEQAQRTHLLQTLTGDHTDGYPGLPGIGPKRAEQALSAPASLGGWATMPWSWDRVVEVFVDHDLTEEDALLQARLARILQWSDWDSKKQEPILWVPSSSG